MSGMMFLFRDCNPGTSERNSSYSERNPECSECNPRAFSQNPAIMFLPLEIKIATLKFWARKSALDKSTECHYI